LLNSSIDLFTEADQSTLTRIGTATAHPPRRQALPKHALAQQMVDIGDIQEQ
jgi:hypothetical protein